VRYRKLLLPLSLSRSGTAALHLGLRLASLWDAHLAGLIIRLDAREAAPLAAEGLSGSMIEDMMNAAERESTSRARALTARFNAALAEAGLAAEPAAAGANASLQVLAGREEDILPAQARLADLTLLPQPSHEEDAASSDSLHNVLFESGRPVLITPPHAPQGLARRCCVAWNGTTEASAALGAALPWLRQAEAVRVLHAQDYQRRGPAAGELLPYLALHGISPDIVQFDPINRDVGAGLLEAASAFDADFLVMGAYSHSRLRQMILGGVTRHVLERAKVPVLMSR
jgi:nucleotide-binding universal stress UspA family protein